MPVYTTGLPQLGPQTTAVMENKSFTDASNAFQDDADTTKQFKFQLSAITPNTTQVLTVPNYTGTIMAPPNEGTSNQVLTSNGAGNAPTFQDAAGGGQTLYDAVVDAGGSADYTDIDSAIVAGKSRIFVQAGTYTITSTINITAAGISIIGEGWDVVVIAGNNLNSDIFKLSSTASDVEIKNIKIDGNSANNTSGDAIEMNSDCDNLRVTNVWFNNIEEHAINAQFSIGNNGMIISNCIMTGSTGEFIDSKITGTLIANCYLNNSNSSGTLIHFNASSDGSAMTGNVIEFTGGGGPCVLATANNVLITGNLMDVGRVALDINGNECTITGNNLDGNFNDLVEVAGVRNVISGNILQVGSTAATSGLNLQSGSSHNVVTGNMLYQTGGTGIVVATSTNNIISNNIIWEGAHGSTTKPAIELSGTSTYNIIRGNHIDNDQAGKMDYGIEETSSSADYNIISGNVIEGWTTAPILRQGVHTTVTTDNSDVSESDLCELMYMENTSGGALAAGDLVVLKATANGDEITTTTTQGDDMVYGMAVETINDASFGYIQIRGKTTALKVDGTTDIAIGDPIGTFTTAKIGMKASVGDMAIAIALEAYAIDDSNGVINALLISPRKI